jgi:hypothetical protein
MGEMEMGMERRETDRTFWGCLVGLCDRYKALSAGKRVILVVTVIWAAQAIPKWTAAILADGETAAAIMSVFVPPKT